MTTQDLSASIKERTIGDAAVDGLLAGIGAGLAMALLLLVVGALSGDSPVTVMERFDPVGSYNLVTGSLAHLAVSAIYGALFGLSFLTLIRLRPSWLRFSWLVGLVFGLVLYAIARSAFSAGIDSGLADYSAPVLLLSHTLYGLVTSLLIGRKWEKVNQV
jgi:drug/metabolite transporter (DMT)-like permease